MKKELQEYSNSKAEYVNNHYTEFWTYGEEYTTLEEFYELCISESTPQNSSYNDVYTISFDETDIVTTTSNFKNTIDFLYGEFTKSYLVVYVETCPNGNDVYNKPCWSVYFLR